MRPVRIPTYRSASGLSADVSVEVTPGGRLVLTVNAAGAPLSVFLTRAQADELIGALVAGRNEATFPPLLDSGE